MPSDSANTQHMPPTPRPAHAVLPVLQSPLQLPSAAHRRTKSTPPPCASSLCHGTTYFPRPASPTPPRPFTPSRQHVYREQVDARHGGLSLDMIADRLMTTAPRPYFPRPPLGHVASRPLFNRSAPDVSVSLTPPAAVPKQRSVSQQHTRRVSADGLQGILLHPASADSEGDGEADAGEELLHDILSVEFARLPRPVHRGSSPPVMQTTGEHITAPRPISPRPASACGQPSSPQTHRRSFSGSFFSRLRSLRRRGPEADEPKLNGHSEVPAPSPAPMIVTPTETSHMDDGWEVWDLDANTNGNGKSDPEHGERTDRRRHKKHGSMGAELLRFIGL